MSFERSACIIILAALLFSSVPLFGVGNSTSRSYYEVPGNNVFIGTDGLEQGQGFGDNFGHALTTGDIDGDGLEDLIVSAPWADGPANSRNDSGEIYVFFGNSSRTYGAVTSIPDMVDMTIYGANDGDLAGQALATGDLDNDGCDDIVIGAPYADGPGNSVENAGEVYIIYGGIRANLAAVYDLNISTADPHQNATVMGNDINFSFGYEIVLADLDDDGFDDLFVCEQWGIGETGIVNNAGRVYISWGSSARLSGNGLVSDTLMPTQIYGNNADDHFGWNMVKGDVDQDGAVDLVISADQGDGTMQRQRHSSGEAYILFGGGPRVTGPNNDIIDTLDVVIYGNDAGDRAGHSLAMGDLDDDGKDDIILGAIGGSGAGNDMDNAGEVSVVWGMNRAAWTTQENLSETGLTIRGALAESWFGYEVFSTDLNNDGYSDLAVYSREADGLYDDVTDTGSVSVIFGSGTIKSKSDLCILDDDGVVTILGTQEEELFGYAMQGFDIDNNGKKDLVVGSKWYNHNTPSLMTHVGKVQVYTSVTPSTTRNDDIYIEGAYDLGGNLTILAGLPVTLVVNVTDDFGTTAIDEVVVFINRDIGTISFRWQKSGGFPVGAVPNSTISILSSSKTVQAGNTLTLEFDMAFGWEVFTLTTVEVLCVGSDSDLDRVAYDMDVLHTLELKGGLVVDYNGTALEPGDWRAAGDQVSFGNMTLVFTGTDVGPAAADFIPVVVTPDGNWTGPAYSPGAVLEIPVTLGLNETTDYLMTLTAQAQTGALQSLPVPEAGFILKLDNGTPEMNSGLTCKPDNDTVGYLDNDDEVFISWAAAADSGAGVSHYLVTHEAGSLEREETWTAVAGLAEGVVNVSVAAVDMFGHTSPAEYALIIIDLTPVEIVIDSPSNGTEFNVSEISVNVTISDLLTGVDGKSIKYRVSDNGTESYGDWVDYPVIEDNQSVECGVTLEFPDGNDNYIQWKAADLVGNEMVSADLLVKVELPVVNLPPVPAITSPADGSEHELGIVEFDATGTTDPEGDEITYTWLVDGVEAGTGRITDYNFTAAGVFTVTLTVDDGQGHQASLNVSVTIKEPVTPPPDDDVVDDDDDDDDDGLNPLFIAIPVIVLILLIILVVVVVLVMMKRSKAKKDAEMEQKLADEKAVWEEEKRKEEIARADPNAVMMSYEKEPDAYIPPGAQDGVPDQEAGEQAEQLPAQEQESLPPGPELVGANVPPDGEGVGAPPTEEQLKADSSVEVPSEEYGAARTEEGGEGEGQNP